MYSDYMGEVFVGSFNAARGMKSPEAGANPAANPLSNRDIRFISSALLGDANKPAVLGKDTAEWVDKRVHGVSYKGVNVVTVDWDGVHEPVADETFMKLLKSPGVSGVAVEYFTPELAARAKAVPVIGGMLEKKVTEPIKSEKDIKGRAHYRNQYKRRLYFGKTMTDGLAEAGTPALCFDIANKPMYMLLRDGAVIGEKILGTALGKTIDVEAAKRNIDTKGMYAKLGSDVPTWWYFSKLIMQMARKGIYDPKKLSVLDTFQLHLEDARRLIIAEGLTQHIDRGIADGTLKKGANILVVYPEAHNLRIRNYMERVTKKDGGLPLKVKDLAYRLVSDPILEFKERSYLYKGGAWQQAGSHKITRQ